MPPRAQRHALIRDIVSRRPIHSQEELLSALRRVAVGVVQSTLSRDLAALNLRKSQGRYVVADTSTVPDRVDLSPAVRGWAACGPHLIVVRTTPGQAQAVALAIDEAADPGIAGTVAGDDTLFIATRNKSLQSAAQDRLARWFGERQ